MAEATSARPRASIIDELESSDRPVDIAIIGGGANGVGVALDAALRGLSVALFERHDFASGTSSRSSKLIHGGVRYLGLGQWSLVREALAERALLLNNAPAIVEPLRFLIPAGNRFEALKYRLGLKVYDWLARRHPNAASSAVTAADAKRLVPAMRTQGLHSAVAYNDALFDDARLVISILLRACEAGALALNYTRVTALGFDHGKRVNGLVAEDTLGGREFRVRARVVVNATGPGGDRVRALSTARGTTGVRPSQGTHLVVNARFLGGDHAMVLPRTADGRIMFAIPWLGHTLLGTTDVEVDGTDDPFPRADEIDDILSVAAEFLDPSPTRADILSSFAGVRPLADNGDEGTTAEVSREHRIDVDRSGLLSISGGKWTTYRRIAEQAVDMAARVADEAWSAGSTDQHSIETVADDCAPGLRAWGRAVPDIEAIVAADPAHGAPLHPALPYCAAQVIHAVRAEFAQTVSDVLSYRLRAMFLNARAAADMAPTVARLMAAELGQDAAWVARETRRAVEIAERFALTPIRVRETPD